MTRYWAWREEGGRLAVRLVFGFNCLVSRNFPNGLWCQEVAISEVALALGGTRSARASWLSHYIIWEVVLLEVDSAVLSRSSSLYDS